MQICKIFMRFFAWRVGWGSVRWKEGGVEDGEGRRGGGGGSIDGDG